MKQGCKRNQININKKKISVKKFDKEVKLISIRNNRIKSYLCYLYIILINFKIPKNYLL